MTIGVIGIVKLLEGFNTIGNNPSCRNTGAYMYIQQFASLDLLKGKQKCFQSDPN